MKRLIALSTLLLASCDAPPSPPSEMDAGPPDVGTPLPEGFSHLVGGSWELGPGAEGYFCAYARVQETTYLDAFHPLTPLGTHHSLLMVLPETMFIDSTVRCSPASIAERVIFGAGAGTETLELPAGVAVKLEEGQQLLLNLHVFNGTSETLRGTSGVLARTVAPEDVREEADATLVGPTSLRIPPRTSDFSVSGHCTATQPQTVFAILPHMHWLGTYMTVTLVRGEERSTLMETAYNFDRQRYLGFDPVLLAPGDRLDVECVYDNPTDSPVVYGDSTLQEMCYAATYAYPPAGTGVICSN